MILASASPRRKELLRKAGFDLVVEPANIDETIEPEESPLALVERLATQKGEAALAAHGELVAGEELLSADTIVWLEDEVLGKPADDQDAARMLRELSGKTHHVSTGVFVAMGRREGCHVSSSFVETTDVTFRELSDDEIMTYVKSGEPLDKAGAYGIQGGAGAFVSALRGDYNNVVGLPVNRVREELARMHANSEKGPVPRSITQIPGIVAAHATLAEGGSGCTVIMCPEGAVGGVDVRGGAPATRETDLLRPEETVGVLHAVVLSGGSVYGLAASCGVTEELERAGIGLNVGVGVAPIVSSACLFDLVVGDASCRPTAADGVAATRAALETLRTPPSEREPLAQGNVGAGTGCSVGKLAGPARMMKAGLGESVQCAGELVCGAVAAVNACGDVCDPSSGKPLAGQLSEDGTSLESTTEGLLSLAATTPLDLEGTPRPHTNTTISCVVTNARLTKAQATKVAQMAADAYAHAIRPTHTTNDGDSVFVMCTGAVDAPVDVVGVLATRALEQAIANAALNATSAFGLKAARDLQA